MTEIPTVILDDEAMYALLDGQELDTFIGNLPFKILYVPTVETDAELDEMTGEVVLEQSQDRQKTKERLYPLVVSGALRSGELLSYTVNGHTFYATVEDDGRLRVDQDRLYWAPSSAATGLRPGTSINGWVSWKREDGTFLWDLRADSGMWEEVRGKMKTSWILCEDWEQVAKENR
jgi:hypothetical protein